MALFTILLKMKLSRYSYSYDMRSFSRAQTRHELEEVSSVGMQNASVDIHTDLVGSIHEFVLKSAQKLIPRNFILTTVPPEAQNIHIWSIEQLGKLSQRILQKTKQLHYIKHQRRRFN